MGFTLIEILVVIVVISLLASLVAPNVFRHLGTAKDATARSRIQMLGAALDAYRLDNGRYPTMEQGIEALSRVPALEPRPCNWRGPYLSGAIPADPWGNPYTFRNPSTDSQFGFDLLSLGAEGESPKRYLDQSEARDVAYSRGDEAGRLDARSTTHEEGLHRRR